MTTVTQIIVDAFRQSNLLAITATPTAAQQTEALRYLNRVVKSTFGFEAGEPFVPVSVGGDNVSRPSGYPYDDWTNDWFVPKNARLILNLEGPITFYLHPNPDDGTRFAYIDSSGTLAVYPIVINANGRRIEGQETIGVNTALSQGEYFYRADTGNWQKYSPLILADAFPFPEEFDEYFISSLALRLNPAYGSQMDGQSQMVFNRSKTQLQARYRQNIPTDVDITLLRMSRMTADNRYYEYYNFNPNDLFNKGWYW